MAKRAMKRKLTPDTRLKLKQRPRGKGFQKGNVFGLATRFPPGVSGNPSGRTKFAEISKALRARLAKDTKGTLPNRTYAEKLADVLVSKGLAGNISAISQIADRCEGRPAVTVDVHDGRPDVLEMLVLSMNQRSEAIGPPEASEYVIEAHERSALTDGESEEASNE